MADMELNVHAEKTGNSVIHLTVAESQNYLTASATVNVSVDMARNFNITASIYPAYIGDSQIDGTGVVKEGNSVTLIPPLFSDYRFVGWKVNGEIVSTNAYYTFTPDSDTELFAIYEEIPIYKITVKSEPEGIENYTLKAKAGEGVRIRIGFDVPDSYRFIGWKVNGQIVSTSIFYDFIVNSNITIVAVYEQIPIYTISVIVQPEDYGTVSGAGEYREGATCTLIAINDDGYTFSEWKLNGETVSEDEEYSFIVTDNIELIAVFKVFSRLPDGYTEVEYIESDGNSYVDTGVNPKSGTYKGDTKIVIDVEPLVAPTSTTKYIAYSKGTISTYNFFNTIQWKTSDGAYGSATTVLSSGSFSTPSKSVGKDTTLRRMLLELDTVNRTFSNDGTEVSISSTSLAYGSPQGNFFLFGTNSTSATNKIKAKLYSCKIYKGPDRPIVRDFVPCSNQSGEVGLYDLVDGQFYGNSGTGSFTAGPTV